MKLSNLDTITILTTSIGMTGVIAVMVGGASCLVGLVGVGTIELGKLIQPHRSTFQKMVFYGGACVGAGLFLGGSGIAIAKRTSRRNSPLDILQRVTVPEFTLVEESVIESVSKPGVCQECKYFHGINYNGIPLNCAVHPYGVKEEKCPDWEKL